MCVLHSVRTVKGHRTNPAGPRGALENWILGQSTRVAMTVVSLFKLTFPPSQTQASILTPAHRLCDLEPAA